MPNVETRNIHARDATHAINRRTHAQRIVGEGDCPLPAGALRAKFVELGSASMTETAAASAWDTLTALESVNNVASICDVWIAAAPAKT